MPEKNSKFKTSFRGYDKNDVNAYITAIGAEMKMKEEMFDTERQRGEREVALANEETKSALKKLDELAFELYDAQNQLSKLKSAGEDAKLLGEKNDELAFELYAAGERERELKNAVSGLSARVGELEGELSNIGQMIGVDDGDSELTQKAALYDKLSDRIGEIMLSADANAEQLLTGASARADEIIENAQKEANEILKAAENEAEKVRSRYKEAAGGYYDEVEIFVSEIKENIENFVREISAKSIELERKIDFIGLPEQAQRQEIPAQCREKDELPAEQIKPKRPYSTIDEKIENFFKKTMATINSFRNKK